MPRSRSQVIRDAARLGHERDDVGVAQLRADANRVGGVQGRGVVAADRSGDAALREAGGSLADRAVRDERRNPRATSAVERPAMPPPTTTAGAWMKSSTITT